MTSSPGRIDGENSSAGKIGRTLGAVRRVVGDAAVDSPSHPGAVNTARGENVGMYRPRNVYGTVRPSSVDEVRRVVEIFDDSDVGCGLHAISTGRNWGLGSREPAHDGAVTLDLSALKSIRALDLDKGWAVIEPGVTQAELAARLVGTHRMVNVTASSAHTSVIGNGLDRGVGLRRQRVDDLVGLEVVLPNGQLVHVGWWPEPDRSTPVYAHGLGPSAMPLFMQSDLGVVTAAAVHLLPRLEAQRVLRLSFDQRNLVPAIDAMRRWVSQGLVGGVLKVYDLVSAEFYGGRVGEFLAHVCVEGTKKSAAALARVLEEEATESGLFTDIAVSTEAATEDDVVMRMVQSAYAGDPTSNDAMLQETLGQEAASVDELGLGWLFFLPMVPFSGDAIAHAHGLLEKIREETGMRLGCTVNALSSDVIDFVVTIKFNRNSGQTEAAHSALECAYEMFSDAGFIPYRLDVDHAQWIDRLVPDSGARSFVRRLKRAIDPNTAIAHGRYS